MVLSTEFMQYVGDKGQKTVTWVEPGDPTLVDNPRNDMFATLVKVYRTKELLVCVV